MEKRYLAMWMWLCEGKSTVKIGHFRGPSVSQKRACISSLLTPSTHTDNNIQNCNYFNQQRQNVFQYRLIYWQKITESE